MTPYDPKNIEPKWQKKWLEEKTFRAQDDSAKPKYYQLETFPYPSAAGLHVGHPKGYIAEDIHARYMRMRGKEVLYTMGWDAFGLPTENYAIKIGKSPKDVAKANTDNFRRQVRMFGFSYDWEREIDTSSPEYYKWTQWLFIQLFKKGLAYRKEAKVNWCPNDQTVLANEQVIDGKCERCGSIIEERDMEQWFLKITQYADRLLADMKSLDWPAATIKRQEDWIGKSVGAEVDFPLDIDYRYVLIHGLGGEANFFPWLKQEFSHRNFSFVIPHLPNPENPTEEEQVNYVLRNTQLNERTVIYGHSLGAAVALKVLEKLERPIAGLVISAGFLEPKFKDHERPFTNTFKWNFDFVKIRQNVGFIRIISDLNDTTVPIEQGRLIHEKLDGRLFETIASAPHFSGTEEPGILSALLPLVTVFTTRPDTLFGATYLVMAPEHIGIKAMWPRVENQKDVERYIEAAMKKTERMREVGAKEKTGIEVKGVSAINPANKEKVPIWIADYVLLGYGTGAIMGVPAHDERDREFALKYKLPVRQVTEPTVGPDFFEHLQPSVTGVTTLEGESRENFEQRKVQHALEAIKYGDASWSGKGKLINSGKFTGMDSEAAKWEITKAVGGRGKEHYKLRDWSVSRQRYWGVPIPMIHCEKCGIIPVPENELPVLLPDLANYRPHGMPPLASSPEFVNMKCPKCGDAARRDAETLDTFVDSSWYYLRYTDPNNAVAIFDKEKVRHWMPVDLYVIGAEHTVLHLLYSRFITKFLYDEGYLKFTEPFLKLRHQGLIRGADGQKMSKSKDNVVNPDDIVGGLGADTVRVYEMFMGPFEDGAPWDPKSIAGVNRFLKRMWNYVNNAIGSAAPVTSAPMRAAVHRAIKKVGEDIESLKFNTAISSLMILLNDLSLPVEKKDLESVVKLTHPFAPHMAQELWSLMGPEDKYKQPLDFEKWPEYDASLIVEETITLVLQVNGRVRDVVAADVTLTEEKAKELALQNPKIKSIIGSQAPKKVIYVDKKLVNIVI